MDPVTHTWDYSIYDLPMGETDLLFTVEVTARERQADGSYADGHVTKKEYRITIWRDRTSDTSFTPVYAEGTALRILSSTVNGEIHETTPVFDPHGNFYYVNLPYETTEVNLSADVSYPVSYPVPTKRPAGD